MKSTLMLCATSAVAVLVLCCALVSRDLVRASHAKPFATFTVTTNADSGAGSLRAAIDAANTNPGPDVISFNAGIGTINVTGMPLPAITEAATIDGGASKVEINGAAAGVGADGLLIAASGVTIKNLVINGFDGTGVAILGDNNVIQGNFIGTNASGTAAVANAAGVLLRGANNTVGGIGPGARNVISGNTGVGVACDGSVSKNNLIQGNFIGTDVGGTLAVPNEAGVATFSSASNNTVGGTAAGAGNTIAFNNSAGVALPSGSGNAVLGNSIFSNGGLAIDISEDAGVTPNDPPCDVDTGPNNLQDFPVLTSAASGGGMTNIQGTLNSTANTTFRIEFFANIACDPSGHGEGQTFLGATNVMTNASCVANFNVTFAGAVPVGKFITTTATDPSNNTSEFSECLAVAAAVGCTIFCPNDASANTGPNATTCAAPVSYSEPGAFGACGAITCAPPSGGFFPVGVTIVTCSEGGGASCSFSVSVTDNTPPKLTCNPSVTTSAAPGKSSAPVNYPLPAASDNCSAVDVTCTPPPGSEFPLGTTLVTCRATDSAANTSLCFFNVTVLDSDAPMIVCPPNIRLSPPAGQTSTVVNYPPPAVTDNLPGAQAVCVPPSGSAFPLGTTTVVCTATDSSGNKSNCSFAVTVGDPQIRITIPTGKAILEFGNPTPVESRRKAKKLKNNPCSEFEAENIGFAPAVLTFDSITRTGADVNSGRIGDPNDLRYYTLYSINAQDSSERTLNVGDTVTIQPGGSQRFCARFNALFPALAGKNTAVPASDDLPDLMTSQIIFRTNAGGPISVPILSHVGTAVALIDPTNPRRPPVVSFSRSGNNFNVSCAAHDSNLDINKARYAFMTSRGEVVASIDVDLAEPLRAANFVRGQSISIEQVFTGAADHPEVTGVEVTVFDGETSVSGSASATRGTPVAAQLLNHTRGATLYLPEVKLKPLIR